jgi:hypothetical protein
MSEHGLDKEVKRLLESGSDRQKLAKALARLVHQELKERERFKALTTYGVK